MKIFVNGNFLTMTDKKIEAIVFDEKIYYVGKMSEALKFDGEVIDLEGKTVIPGIIDCSHKFINIIQAKTFLDLENVTNIYEIKLLIEHQKRYSKNEIIVGYDYDNNKLEENRNPTKEDLEYPFPVFLIHKNNSKGVVNKVLMNMYQLETDFLEGEEFIDFCNKIYVLRNEITDTIPYVMNFYYERGIATVLAKINNKYEYETIKKANYDNIVSIKSENIDIKLDKIIIRIDSDTRYYLQYQDYELLEMLIKLNEENKQVFFLVHNINGVDQLKRVIKDIEIKPNNKWILAYNNYLLKEDIKFFKEKNLLFEINIQNEIIEHHNYNKFDYLRELEKNGIKYSLFTEKRIDETDFLMLLRELFKNRYQFEEDWKQRLLRIFEAITINKAYNLNLDHLYGKIEEDMNSNFVVFNCDIFNSFEEIKINQTYKDGKLVYDIDKK